MWRAVLDYQFTLVDLDSLCSQMAISHFDYPDTASFFDAPRAWLAQIIDENNPVVLDHFLMALKIAVPGLSEHLASNPDPELWCCLDNPCDEQLPCWRSLPPREKIALDEAISEGKQLCEDHKLDLLTELSEMKLNRLRIFRHSPTDWLLNSAKLSDIDALLGFCQALCNLGIGSELLAELSLAWPWILERLQLWEHGFRPHIGLCARLAKEQPNPPPAPSPEPSPISVISKVVELVQRSPSPSAAEKLAAQIIKLAERLEDGNVNKNLNRWIENEKCGLPKKMGTLQAYLLTLSSSDRKVFGKLLEDYGSQCDKERQAIEDLGLSAEFFRPHHECPCCKDELMGQDIIATSCMHTFHVACLNKWLRIKNFCPVCRTAQNLMDDPSE